MVQYAYTSVQSVRPVRRELSDDTGVRSRLRLGAGIIRMSLLGRDRLHCGQLLGTYHCSKVMARRTAATRRLWTSAMQHRRFQPLPQLNWDQQYIAGPPKQAQTSLVEVGGIIGGMGDSEMVLGARFIAVINKDALSAIWTAAAEEMMAHHTHNVNTEFSGTRVRRLDVLVPLNKKKITHMGGLAWEEGGEDMKRQRKTVGGQGMGREAAMG
ncbi:hypothetical protein C8J57DRAFT_1243576 [Mycena rebaudengoi]|nr:hypothetical protein C8J57DRAFT_1243576 [Mycena rebaudengoi]